MKFSNLPPKPPSRQIRALQEDDGTTITVYQAYPSTIATAAVIHQRLDASPEFRTTRMTWIKPSWAWMLYRSGYSYKDPGQERILAIKMKREDFLGLLRRGVLTHGTAPPHPGPQQGQKMTSDAQERTSGESGEEAAPKESTRESKRKDRLQSLDVKIQWDPERTVRLHSLNYRSIQIGIPAGLIKEWAQDMIVNIEDVTDKARTLKKILDERPDMNDEELAELGLIPKETEFEVPVELRSRLGMYHDGLVMASDP
ncbi:uncharacterized protein B0T23DRAFT_246213 [Neurospora hispaniola]|uniref:ATP-dependent RNA helicase DHX8 n=1 Tax=Neurospora hispaniola TaxID=588809 RepID=A0AAJ0I080_9PEZI|nr:hypothetical protein B0T23DRAFT_246213 [Neurospora hispaniola]